MLKWQKDEAFCFVLLSFFHVSTGDLCQADTVLAAGNGMVMNPTNPALFRISINRRIQGDLPFSVL